MVLPYQMVLPYYMVRPSNMVTFLKWFYSTICCSIKQVVEPAKNLAKSTSLQVHSLLNSVDFNSPHLNQVASAAVRPLVPGQRG